MNSKRHNITTIIRIRNLINNTNLIDAPIHLNLTNKNDMRFNKSHILLKSLEGTQKKCCSIIHPQDCHTVSEVSKPMCFTRKHYECSELCNNGRNLVIKTGTRNQCITIAVHPYYYCGYYSIEGLYFNNQPGVGCKYME